jgi:AcrR family transcriptional regulator
MPPRGPQQLPPGRHGLPRSFVARNQRERILAAVADECSASGYAAMSVEDIVLAAGVSRRTFYDHFRSKEDAFLAAYDAAVQQIFERVWAAHQAATDFNGRVRASLEAFLSFVASEPAFGDMCLVEVLAAGPAALERRNNAIKGFMAIVEATAEELPEAQRPPPLTAETVIGGIYEVVYARIVRGQAHELLDLLPDIIYSALLPYVGHDEAAVERRRLREAARVTPP